MKPDDTTTTRDIFLYIPNLIGYVRILLALISFYYMPTDHVKASICYLLNSFLDEIDGRAARFFNQTSNFGAMMDPLTDHISNACLLMTLAVLYPNYTFCFQLSLMLNITSHWIYMHSCVMEDLKSHKSTKEDGNPILRFYYTYEIFLSVMCFGNELFYCMLYLLHFTGGPIVFGISIIRVVLYINAPVTITKTIINLLHLVDGSLRLASIDVRQRNKMQ